MATVTTALDPAATVDGADSVSRLRRKELGAFLRSRRERITPEQAGVANAGRRRTPGLRREEVAQVAGVGVTWYTWLEQGRDINVSGQVLEAVARVLLLDPHERAHLFTLADASLPYELECECLPPEVVLVVDKLDPYPAYVTNGRYDLLAYNRAYQALIGDLDSLPFDQRNSMWLLFTSPTLRTSLLELDETAACMVGQYRTAMADHLGEPAWKCLVNRLNEASPEFAKLWQRHELHPSENRTKRYLHPEVGLLQLHCSNLWLGQRMSRRLVTYTPADDATASALPRLATLPPRPLS